MKTMRWITQRLLLPLMLALVIMPAGATETLDQSQTSSQSSATVSFNVPRGQIFTAGMYGTLNRVSLYLENWVASPPAGAVLTVSVQTVIGGLPSGKQIGSGTIPLSAIPAPIHADWVNVSIRGAVVHADTPYALVLQTSLWNASVNWWYGYNTSYTGGEEVVNYGDGWITQGMYDFRFQTYVIPDVLDQWQYSGIARMGVLKNWRLAQTFTAGLSGVIDRVRVPLENLSATGPVEASIQTLTKDGYPSGTVIGQGSIPASLLLPYASWGSWLTIPISDAAVTAGMQYALILSEQEGQFNWFAAQYDVWPGGEMIGGESYFWAKMGTNAPDAQFETYVATPLAFAPPPPPPVDNTPCSFGVCPSVTASIGPKDSPARVTSLVQFWEMPNGKIQGILHFDDSRTGSLALKGCGTNSAACRLTVEKFACTDQHAIQVAGSYTFKGEEASEYELTLSGVKGEVGNFTLDTGNYTYTVTHKGIVDVTCPPAAEAAGLR